MLNYVSVQNFKGSENHSTLSKTNILKAKIFEKISLLSMHSYIINGNFGFINEANIKHKFSSQV
jgi:hypothetical protein